MIASSLEVSKSIVSLSIWFGKALKTMLKTLYKMKENAKKIEIEQSCTESSQRSCFFIFKTFLKYFLFSFQSLFIFIFLKKISISKFLFRNIFRFRFPCRLEREFIDYL